MLSVHPAHNCVRQLLKNVSAAGGTHHRERRGPTGHPLLGRGYPERFNCLAGAGGIEPPNGGIKIRLIILLFQDVFGKMDEIRSSNFNTLAAVSK
jgi:cold shock CspA family protein